MSRFFCEFCHEEIPAEVIARRHYSPANTPPLFFCSREHSNLYRQATGGYKAMSAAGKDARSVAVKQRNHLSPRLGSPKSVSRRRRTIQSKSGHSPNEGE